MIDFKILLLDDEFKTRQKLIDDLAAIGVADRGIDPPWHITLGDYDLNVDCETITDPAAVKLEFTPGQFGKAVMGADLILLDNDWHKTGHAGFKFGVDLLSNSGWRRGPGPVLAIFTGADTYRPEFVKKALDSGADALVYKDETTHLLNVLLTAVERKSLLSKWNRPISDSDPALISKSPAMQRFLAEAARVAGLRMDPVLILGEVGTGKSRLARAMHGASPRAKAPFQPVNPGQISDSVLHAELFGVATRAAYTGAVPRKGYIEVADGGTVLIDDAESMSEAMQSALLEFIQSRRYVRMGDPQQHSVDVRFMFATNADLQDRVDQGKFRGDFLSRIDVHVLRMPRLADRLEDIPSLAASFIRDFYADNFPGAEPPTITADALDVLRATPFSDNIRGLSNAIRRSLAQLPLGANLDAARLVLSKPTAASVESTTRDDIGTLIDLAPRSGGQRAVFDLLVGSLPSVVPYEQLNNAVGASGNDLASESLMIAVSRLRDRLRSGGFSIRQDKDLKGYALVRVVEDA